MTGIIDNSKTEQRKKWCDLLHAAWMFHQQMASETKPVIKGDTAKKMADDHMFHTAISVAIQDAINLIQQMEAMGYFQDDEGLLSTPGPMG